MITFKQFVSESINDSGILKAIFVIGMPGAGKSYTITQLKGTITPKVVNSDKSSEFLSRKWGKEIKTDNWLEYKDTTHRMTSTMLLNYVNGMLPLFIDGTSNDVSNILNRIGILESLGYDVGVVFINSSLETAKRRASKRAEEIGRHIDIDFIESVNKENKENASYLKSKVSFFKEIDNDSDYLDNKEMSKAFKAVQGFFNEPVKNPVGKRIISELSNSKTKYLIPEIISNENLEKKCEAWYRSV